MNVMSNAEFAEAVLRMAAPTEQFEPTTTYDPDGDCIEFIAQPDDFYAERIDDLVTVYYSRTSNEVIGSLIKGVSSFCEKMVEKFPGFMIEIRDGKVRLQHLFRARLWADQAADPKDVRVITYQKLIEVAEQADAEAEVSTAC